MPKKTRRAVRRHKREALVHSHLERVSRSLLDKHPNVVRNFIGRNAGIYALYKGDKLYYVGLARGLSSRLKTHRRTRKGDWDRFSIYLTVKDQHLREIESLVLQIADPKGNKQGGRPSGSRDMRRRIEAAIRAEQRQAIDALFKASRRVKAVVPELKREAGQIARLMPMGARLRAVYKGKVYRARARKDGRIRFNGQIYPSLSSAGAAVMKRAVNGWWFWQVERGKGNWVRLVQIRKAGTPIYPK